MSVPYCRYLSDIWREVRDRHGMNNSHVVKAWRARFAEMEALGYSRKEIAKNRLDNPFISDMALRIMRFDMAVKRANNLAGRKLGRFYSIGNRATRKAA